MLSRSTQLLALAVLAASSTAQAATWSTVLSENFNAPLAAEWTYTGTQSAGQNLFRYNVANGNIDATWDQTAGFADGSPQTIVPSYLTRPLPNGLTLTDTQTFKVWATVHVSSHSSNTAFYQIANFGLYNRATTGPDRLLSDYPDVVGNANNFLEFNYFVPNDPNNFYGPMSPSAQVTGGAASGAWLWGPKSAPAPYVANTDMGFTGTNANWLPAQDLLVEVTYFGAATDGTARRALSEIFTTDGPEPVLLSVNGVAQRYWTDPLGAGESFALTDVGFANYVGSSWSGEYGAGTGTYDDLGVAVDVPEPASAALLAAGLCWLLRRRKEVRHRVPE